MRAPIWVHFSPWRSIFPVKNRFSHIFPAPEGSLFLTVILTVKLARLVPPPAGCFLHCTLLTLHSSLVSDTSHKESSVMKVYCLLLGITPPVNRVCAPGGSIQNHLDAQLIQPLVSQVATRKVQQVRFEFLINTRAPDEANNS